MANISAAPTSWSPSTAPGELDAKLGTREDERHLHRLLRPVHPGRDSEPNIRVVSDLVRRARDGGADLVLTPENTGLTEPSGKLRRAKARDEAERSVACRVARCGARDRGWLLIGSLAVDLSGEAGKTRARPGSPTALT